MKQKFKIGIVDDDPGKITQIITRMMMGISEITPEKQDKYSQYELEPYEIKIKKDLKDMVDEVITLELDCVLVDYKLASYEVVSYTGIEFAKLLEDTIYDFPIFVLTSYEDDLFKNEIFNAYQVFDFARYLGDKSERVELHFKIIEQILKTTKQREQWEREIKRLLPLAGTSEEIDSRLLELDTKIEKSINGTHALPEKIKRDLNENKLNELLSKMEQILNIRKE